MDGSESKEDLEGLGRDILQYYGLGCRNVSKLFLPKGYDLNLIFGGLYPHRDVIKPRLKPVNCHKPSRPKHPGMIGFPGKWQSKNQRSGLISNSAITWPLPCSPPSSEISVMRSIINIGGSGNCAFPGPNNSPRAHFNKSSRSKLTIYIAQCNALETGALNRAQWPRAQ